VSYLNYPRKGYPRGKKIWVWTHLGLIKWKTTLKKIRNGRQPQKKMEGNLQKNMEDNLKKNKKWKRPQTKIEDDLKKNMKTTSKKTKSVLYSS
jgi:hypothetical protein